MAIKAEAQPRQIAGTKQDIEKKRAKTIRGVKLARFTQTEDEMGKRVSW